MQQTNYDSEFCGKVPIHLTNLIQPYGALLVLDNSRRVVQVSENINQIFGLSHEQMIGRELADLLSTEDYAVFNQKIGNKFSDKIPGIWSIAGERFLVTIHDRDQYYLVEIEVAPIREHRQDTFAEVYQEIKYAMSRIESTESLEEACVLAAKELKRISGFDKVMIYSFDAEWNGTVIAEEREDDMESYYRFTFPASDIPKQARQLYLKNSYRLIPDRNYTPVKLFPVISPSNGSFIDLSDCNVRSVTAVHVEYLKNMGVVASMSTRILHRENLWGLIACHHKTPKYLRYEMYSIFEMLSGIISGKITSLENRIASFTESSVATTYSQMVENIYKHKDLDQCLLSPGGVIKLFDAQGAAISRNGRFHTIGTTPGKDQLEELLLWLHTRQLKKAFATDRLPSLYEYALDYASVASGLLAIPINAAKDSYLMVFRPEIIKIIRWGGNPNERIIFEKDEKNYHPRHSFQLWQQQVSGVAEPWKNEELKIAETLRSFIYEFETSN